MYENPGGPRPHCPPLPTPMVASRLQLMTVSDLAATRYLIFRYPANVARAFLINIRVSCYRALILLSHSIYCRTTNTTDKFYLIEQHYCRPISLLETDYISPEN